MYGVSTVCFLCSFISYAEFLKEKRLVVMLDRPVYLVDPYLGLHTWSSFLDTSSCRVQANKHSYIFLINKQQWKFLERSEFIALKLLTSTHSWR
jgi:hypothetical protein